MSKEPEAIIFPQSKIFRQVIGPLCSEYTWIHSNVFESQSLIFKSLPPEANILQFYEKSRQVTALQWAEITPK